MSSAIRKFETSSPDTFTIDLMMHNQYYTIEAEKAKENKAGK